MDLRDSILYVCGCVVSPKNNVNYVKKHMVQMCPNRKFILANISWFRKKKRKKMFFIIYRYVEKMS